MVLPLSYRDEVETVPLTQLGSTSTESLAMDQETAASAYEQGYDEGLVDGFVAGQLGLTEEQLLAPEREYGADSATIARNTYSYACRYLMRRAVFNAVFDTVHRQVREYIQAYQFGRSSLVLVGYSLGSIIGLDLLQMPEASYFRRLITLGSPLGGIARIPVVHRKLLPLELRQVPVEWFDVATAGDRVAFWRVTTELGFVANPLHSPITIPGDFTKPHNAYLADAEAIRQWVALVDLTE
jgi:pimeloyl-ACP methyl ester carboxylesterase